MLLLVPNTLREASAALGLPQWLVIRHVAYRAARAGIITGVLLAIARITGETAPLLFTALNNQFFSWNLNAPMASLPVVIFQFALSPYAGLAAARLDRGSPHHRRGARPEHPGAHAFLQEGADMSLAIHTDVKEAAETPSRDRCALEEKVSVRRLNFYYGDYRALADNNVSLYKQQGDGVHRAVRLRQVHAAAHPQPHLRPLSQPAGRGRGAARRREHPQSQAGPQSAPRQGRAWCSRSRRRSP